MTIEIKFRCFDPKKNKMIKIHHLEWAPIGLCINRSIKTVVGSSDYNTPDKQVILMQYTGLKDKNGKECYQKDIVKLIKTTNPDYGEEKIGVLEYDNGRVYIAREDDDDLMLPSPTYPENLEIIGNIYENPELFRG